MYVCTLTACVCGQQMRAVVTVDSFAEGTRRPQRGWSSSDGNCRHSMNSCAASMARTPHIRKCYRYAHTAARTCTHSWFQQTAGLQQIKVMPKLGWRDFFLWHQLKSWSQDSVHAAGVSDVWFRMCCNNADRIWTVSQPLGQFSGAQEKARMTLPCKLCPLIHEQPPWEQQSCWKNSRNCIGMIKVQPRGLCVFVVC